MKKKKGHAKFLCHRPIVLDWNHLDRVGRSAGKLPSGKPSRAGWRRRSVHKGVGHSLRSESRSVSEQRYSAGNGELHPNFEIKKERFLPSFTVDRIDCLRTVLISLLSGSSRWLYRSHGQVMIPIESKLRPRWESDASTAASVQSLGRALTPSLTQPRSTYPFAFEWDIKERNFIVTSQRFGGHTESLTKKTYLQINQNPEPKDGDKQF